MNHRLRLFIVSSLSYLSVACTPQPNAVSQTALDQLARAAVRQETVIDSATLSDRLLSSSDSLTLIDIRDQDQFAAKHIKQAINDTVTNLVIKQNSGALAPQRDIVLYDNDGGTSAQAAALLRLAGRTNTYYLKGGFNNWQAYFTKSDTATLKDAHTAQTLAKKAAASCWFEGNYVAMAGLLPKADKTIKPSAGYVPSLQPAAPPPTANNALGLGLDLGLGPQPSSPPPANDTLGLGLGLGLGPQTTPRPVGRLKIGEGC